MSRPVMARGAAAPPVTIATTLASVLLVAVACGPRRGPVPPLPRTAGVLVAQRLPAGPFRAALRGRVRSPGGRVRFAAGLGALPPDFRIDLFHPAGGATLFSLGVAGGRLRALWPEEGECLEAEATARLMGRLLGLQVEPDELLPLLTGHVYPDGKVTVTPRVRPGSAGPAGDRGGDRIVVDATSTATGVSWTARLARNRGGLALDGRRQAPDGETIQVAYPHWVDTTAGGVGHPRTVRLRLPSRRFRLDLEVREWAAGGPPRAALLPLLPPGCVRLSESDLERRPSPWSVPHNRSR